jgi:N-acetyl-gamma-glutamyl-phosphate reductase
MKQGEIDYCLRSFYVASPLVRIHVTPDIPQIQRVVRTSYCDVGFELAKDVKQLVLISCLDNLLKGAAGQAVQNINLMCMELRRQRGCYDVHRACGTNEVGVARRW